MDRFKIYSMMQIGSQRDCLAKRVTRSVRLEYYEIGDLLDSIYQWFSVLPATPAR
jgi:hypothetical protein